MSLTSRALSSGLSTLLLLAALTACSSDDTESTGSNVNTAPAGTSTDEDASNSEATDNQGSASLEVGDEVFSFALASCLITDTDVLLHGPGEESASGEVGYLSIDMVRSGDETSGDARVDIGATRNMQSTDDTRIFSTYAVNDYSITFAGEAIEITAPFITPESPEGVPGTLNANCS